MKKRLFRWPRPWAILLVIIIGLFATVQLTLWMWHPMFYNQFMMHDGLPFLHWWPEGSYDDHQGNTMIADYHRNVLAIFLLDNSKIDTSRFSCPRPRQGGAVFSSWEDEIKYYAPQSTNKLYVFGADGKRSDFPLAAGEAERIHKLMEPDPPLPDLVQLLERVYPEKHSAEYSASLREAIANLKTKRNKREESSGPDRDPAS